MTAWSVVKRVFRRRPRLPEMNGNAPSPCDESALTGYAVHPSFAEPRELTPVTALGTGTSDMGGWDDRYSDEEQDDLLRATWDSVCAWAESQGVDRVEVDSFEKKFTQFLVDAGFTPTTRSFWAPFGLEYVGSSVEVAHRMMVTFDVPTINLIASRSGCQIVRVVDLSWDSMFLYAEESPEL